MGCGCGKKRTLQARPASGDPSVAASSAQPVMYDVIDKEGALVASSSNIVFARVEARRTGGTVVPRSSAPTPVASVTETI